MEPKILLVGKIGPIMKLLQDELNDNYGRNVVGASLPDEVEKIIGSEAIDLVILGAGFDDTARDGLASRITEIDPTLDQFLVPRVGEKSPTKLVDIVNSKAIEWKFMKALGGKPGDQMQHPKT